MKAERILAWHFTYGPKLRDGQALVVGKTYSVEGKMEMCSNGLHASRRLIDALQYAPGAYLSRVECWGDVEEEEDKLVCRNRRVIAFADATMMLHEAACHIAEEALRRAKVKDERCWNVIETKRRWMRGEAKDSELSSAMDAARDAARGTFRASAVRGGAWDAAWVSAGVSARNAAWGASWVGSWVAARNAFSDSARNCVWNVARDAQNQYLEREAFKFLGLADLEGEVRR